MRSKQEYEYLDPAQKPLLGVSPHVLKKKEGPVGPPSFAEAARIQEAFERFASALPEEEDDDTPIPLFRSYTPYLDTHGNEYPSVPGRAIAGFEDHQFIAMDDWWDHLDEITVYAESDEYKVWHDWTDEDLDDEYRTSSAEVDAWIKANPVVEVPEPVESEFELEDPSLFESTLLKMPADENSLDSAGLSDTLRE